MHMSRTWKVRYRSLYKKEKQMKRQFNIVPYVLYYQIRDSNYHSYENSHNKNTYLIILILPYNANSIFIKSV